MNNKYPRFFILAKPEMVEEYSLWRQILYVKLDSPKAKCKHIYHDGTASLGYSSEILCDHSVDRGVWKEIGKEEVALL